MDGPSHYREAEQLIREAESAGDGEPTIWSVEEALATAQVHATLALAAATALSDGEGLSLRDYSAWCDVAAKKPDRPDGVTR